MRFVSGELSVWSWGDGGQKKSSAHLHGHRKSKLKLGEMAGQNHSSKYAARSFLVQCLKILRLIFSTEYIFLHICICIFQTTIMQNYHICILQITIMQNYQTSPTWSPEQQQQQPPIHDAKQTQTNKHASTQKCHEFIMQFNNINHKDPLTLMTLKNRLRYCRFETSVARTKHHNAQADDPYTLFIIIRDSIMQKGG